MIWKTAPTDAQHLIRRLCWLAVVPACALRAADLPPPVTVEAQPLAANVQRVVEALEFLGTPLEPEKQSALAAAGNSRDAARLQQLLDAEVLFLVNLNPEARVKVARGPASARLQQAGWTPVLVKVVNESGGTQRLRLRSPQAGPVYAGVAKLSMERQKQERLRENENTRGVTDRFLEAEMFTGRPMTESLSGLRVEYAIALLYSAEAGRREATIGFDIGQGTENLGFRSELPVLFDIRPAIPIRLAVRDHDGTPTTEEFTKWRNALSRGDVVALKGMLAAQPALATSWDPINRGWLQLAAERGNMAVLELLLESKAEVDAVGDRSGSVVSSGNRETALHVAALRGYAEIVRRLLAAGANPNARTSSNGTPLHHALQTSYLRSEIISQRPRPGFDSVARAETIRLLCHAGADLFAVADRGTNSKTPLDLVAQPGFEEYFALLLTNARPRDVRSPQGRSLLEIAREHDRPDTVLTLATPESDDASKLPPPASAGLSQSARPADAGRWPPGTARILAAHCGR